MRKSDLRRVLHLEREFPWPLANREIIACCSSFLIKERKGAMIMLRSATPERADLWDI